MRRSLSSDTQIDILEEALDQIEALCDGHQQHADRCRAQFVADPANDPWWLEMEDNWSEKAWCYERAARRLRALIERAEKETE